MGTRITRTNNEVGEIPVYGGGDITFYTNKSNRDENTLIVSRYALSKMCVRLLENKFYLNDSGLSIHSKDISLQKYGNFILLNEESQKYIYTNCTSGSIQKNLNMNLFNNFKIPVPKTGKKIQEWVDKISIPYNEKNEKQTMMNELGSEIKNRIKEITENEECDEVEFDKILKYVPKINKYKASDGTSNGLYQFYTSSQDKILYRDDFEFEDSHILIGRGGNVSIHLATKFSVSHDDVYVIKLLDYNNDLRYIFNYLKTNINLISCSFKGSTIKHSSKEGLSKIMIKIPKNKQLITDMDSMFQEIEKLQMEIKTADELYKQYIQELGNEAKQGKIKINNEESNVVIKKPIVKIRKINKQTTV